MTLWIWVVGMILIGVPLCRPYVRAVAATCGVSEKDKPDMVDHYFAAFFALLGIAAWPLLLVGLVLWCLRKGFAALGKWVLVGKS